MTYTDTRPVTGTRPASRHRHHPPARTPARRVLIPIQDAAQAEHAVELARRAGASQALVLHLNLRRKLRRPALRARD